MAVEEWSAKGFMLANTCERLTALVKGVVARRAQLEPADQGPSEMLSGRSYRRGRGARRRERERGTDRRLGGH